MQARHIAVNLSDEAAERYDAAITGDDDDVLLNVEKAIFITLYGTDRAVGHMMGLETDADRVAVEEG